MQHKMKKLFWFCQMLAVGGAITTTAMLTPAEAEQHRSDLAKDEGVERVYMTPIEAML